MTNKDRGIEVDRRMHLTCKGVIGDDTRIHLDNKIIEPILIGEDNGV